MKHSLKDAIGMDKADHQRQYAAAIDCGMREARRLMGGGSGKSREKMEKALKRDKNKEQQEMPCQQLLDRSAEYAEKVSSELSAVEIITVSEVEKLGSRVQDKENLWKQV